MFASSTVVETVGLRGEHRGERLGAVQQHAAATAPELAQAPQLREAGVEVNRELEIDDAERTRTTAGDRNSGVRRAGRAQHDELEQCGPFV